MPRGGPCAAKRRPRTAERRPRTAERRPRTAERRPLCCREEAPVPREGPLCRMVFCAERIRGGPVSGGGSCAERRPSVPGGPLC